MIVDLGPHTAARTRGSSSGCVQGNFAASGRRADCPIIAAQFPRRCGASGLVLMSWFRYSSGFSSGSLATRLRAPGIGLAPPGAKQFQGS